MWEKIIFVYRDWKVIMFSIMTKWRISMFFDHDKDMLFFNFAAATARAE